MLDEYIENTIPYFSRSALKLTNNGSVLYDLDLKKHILCNKDLTSILVRCNGRNKVKDIGLDLSRNRIETEKTAKVINDLSMKGFLKKSERETLSGVRIIDKHVSKFHLDSVFIEATKKCNLSCIHCYNEGVSPNNELNYSEISRFIDNTSRLGVLKIRFTGGEPFVRKDLIELLEKAYSSMVDFSIFTNGILIDNNAINRLSILNPEFVAISVDSHDPKIYTKIRGQDYHKKILSTMEKMLERNINLRANIVLFEGINDSYSSIKSVVKLLKNMGFKKNELSFDEVVPEGRGTNIQVYNNKKRVDIMNIMSDVYQEVYGMDFTIKKDSMKPRDIKSFCGLGESFFYLRSDGDVSLCPMLNSKEYILGNIFKDDIKELWENNKLLNFFRKNEHIKGSECDPCDKISMCAGGCKAKSLFFNGGINKADPWMCAYFKEKLN